MCACGSWSNLKVCKGPLYYAEGKIAHEIE